MSALIKTTKSWKRHLPQKPQKVQRGYYTRQKNSQQKIIIRIIFVIFAILVLQSIFQIKFLRVQNINLNNNNDLSTEEVQEFVLDKLTATKFFFFEKNNYFLVPIDELDVQLVAEYNLEEVSLEKIWPNTLEITVKEKNSHFIWQKDDSIYLLDAKGLLNRQISILDDKYLLLDDKRDQRPSGEQIFTDQEINIINQIYLNWMDMVASKAKLNKITIYNDWSIELNTQTGFYVKLDKDQDIHEQLNNLKAVLEENITGVDIDYIDVRFGDKVYFK
ncbi:MAG: FtsQ-type POTRA domain-containing protein [Candidatus Komeilibacteria bacterium]|jgi:cell division septal protein FtsQ|nr:FtsQ-type POTRA domain-containing protein [Candidatus Komeilibacteria bacterium]